MAVLGTGITFKLPDSAERQTSNITAWQARVSTTGPSNVGMEGNEDLLICDKDLES